MAGGDGAREDARLESVLEPSPEGGELGGHPRGLSLLSAGELPRRGSGQLRRRLFVLGQRRVIREPSGWGHFVIFWGFLLITVGTGAAADWNTLIGSIFGAVNPLQILDKVEVGADVKGNVFRKKADGATDIDVSVKVL